MRRLAQAVAAVAVALLVVPALAAAPSPIVGYPTPTSNSGPFAITKGPDGALWFTESDTNKVGRITIKGAIHEFELPAQTSQPLGIAAGPDGSLWVVCHSGWIVRLKTGGGTTAYQIPSDHLLYGIARGSDGAMWFTEEPPTSGGGTTSGEIGRITMGGKVTEYQTLGAGTNPTWIASGPDGNVWYSDGDASVIGRVTPEGKITQFEIPGGHGIPEDITEGPDGALWFADQNHGRIGRITTAGKITEFQIHASSLIIGIASGPAHALWVGDPYFQAIWRVTTAGKATRVTLGGANIRDIVAGPDGNLWFTNGQGAVGRVSAGAAGSSG